MYERFKSRWDELKIEDKIIFSGLAVAVLMIYMENKSPRIEYTLYSEE